MIFLRPLLIGLVASASVLHAATTYQLENNQLVLPGPIVFETGKDALKLAESEDALKHIQQYLADKSYITTLRIEVHTDNSGNVETNQALSERRALAVAKWLVGKGVDCHRLVAVGFGDTKPVAPNDTPENKSKNRRVAVVNAALRGHLIDGMPADGGGKVAGDPCRK